eukprot:scaffold5173_cov125-Isochrysis_galbana.AAC.4
MKGLLRALQACAHAPSPRDWRTTARRADRDAAGTQGQVVCAFWCLFLCVWYVCGEAHCERRRAMCLNCACAPAQHTSQAPPAIQPSSISVKNIDTDEASFFSLEVFISK